MEEFNTIEKVQELFRNVNCLGNDNTFFVAYNDKQKQSGMVGGMEHPYDGLLINANEAGIGMFYLKTQGMGGLLMANISKMNVCKDQFFFIPNSDIASIKVKNYALFNSKTKRIEISTTNKTYKLFAKFVEKDFPYQTDNFTKFVNKYGK